MGIAVLQTEKKPGYNAHMDELCVGRGWCGRLVDGQPSHVDDFILESGSATADQFVDWLLMAYSTDRKKINQNGKNTKGLREFFVHHMGHEVVGATPLKWSLD